MIGHTKHHYVCFLRNAVGIVVSVQVCGECLVNSWKEIWHVLLQALYTVPVGLKQILE